MLRILSAFLLVLFSLSAAAAANRTDYDLDNDGLIEINDWADLNEVRNNLTGNALYGSSVGCPATGCKGFELTKDLDFDTNGDGLLNASDAYWNAGAGWVAIGDGYLRGDELPSFRAVFDGNGHVIRNLVINRPLLGFQGLFGYTENATLRNLGLNGKLMSIVGDGWVGGLIGSARTTSINSCYSQGVINGNGSSVGGLVGEAQNSSITASFGAGSVKGYEDVGGLVGTATNTTLQTVFSNANLAGSNNVGGLVGLGEGTLVTAAYATGNVGGDTPSGQGGLSGRHGAFTNSYWATDTTGQALAGNSTSNGTGVTLAQLQCPTAANNTNCAIGKTLYQGWAALKDANGNAYWNFGTATQLPGLFINGSVYRDSDGDGYLDSDDLLPKNYAVSQDGDSDGAPDFWTPGCNAVCQATSGVVLDKFPGNKAASVDTDLDSYPDAWASGCDLTCQAASGLVLDAYPNDINNNGISDGVEPADANGNGLIDIATWRLLDAVRNNLSGTGRQLTPGGAIDSSGCPPRLVDGVLQSVCRGYELTADLDFDTNGDGLLDASDAYWNAGAGWVAIGTSSTPFTATFEGNGHVIRNLMIKRLTTPYQGLFGYTANATLRNLGLKGKLMSIIGQNYVGGLAGSTGATVISGCFSTGISRNASEFSSHFGGVGGLVGTASGGSITASFSMGTVVGFGNVVGGLVGDARGTILKAVFSTANVSGVFDYAGGIAGYGGVTSAAYATGKVKANPIDDSRGLVGAGGGISNSYWAKDSTGQNRPQNGATGVSLAQLQCPTAADDIRCANGTILYQGWGDLKDANGNAYWDFGTTTQLPGLVLNGVVYRDSDSDGLIDEDDTDDDNDGTPDAMDAFSSNAAAYVDVDADGHPDTWTANCNTVCQAASGLVLDRFPNNAAASVDADSDGKPDAWNASCNSACQTASGLILDIHLNDTDNDGVPGNINDTADPNGNGLIDVSSWAQLDAIRHNLSGTGRQMSNGGPIDTSGCPPRLVNGLVQPACYGYELTTDLDFDTNGDGVLDRSDTYWNEGTGWLAIGNGRYAIAPFTSTFDGNGHVIHNLMSKGGNAIGLFGTTENATVRNLGLKGKLMSISGFKMVGGLVGDAQNTDVSGCYSIGAIRGEKIVGGLIGNASSGSITASFSAGSVLGFTDGTGGLVGQAGGTTLKAVFSTATVGAYDEAGGLVGLGGATAAGYATGNVAASSNLGGIGGLSGNNGGFNNSYWATDTTGQPSNGGSIGGTGVTLAQLKCPIAADNTSCVSGTTLYQGWGDLEDANGNPYWDFGTDTQLPGLVIKGVVYRDNDGDGFLDKDDAMPNHNAASQDTDGDGSPDSWNARCDATCQTNSGLELDAFPTNPAASLDADGDGRPEAWHATCSFHVCQPKSGLIHDYLPNDRDNDGLVDSLDSDNTQDGGKPTILVAPQDLRLPATGATTAVTLALAEVIAFDDVDSTPTLKVFLGGDLLIPNASNQVFLPSGLLKLKWVAIDDAGNASAPVEQTVDIYTSSDAAPEAVKGGSLDCLMLLLTLTCGLGCVASRTRR